MEMETRNPSGVAMDNSEQKYIDPADRQNLNKSFDVFRAEVRHFWEDKSVSCLTWFAFVFLTVTNIVVIVYSATPSWGKTNEIVGQGGNFEGAMDGYYGVWYACYELYDENKRRERYCRLWTDAMYIPDWWGGYQALMTLTFIFGFFAFIVLAFYIFLSRYNKSVKIMLAYIICSLLAALCSTGGVILFCVLFLKEAYWCCSPEITREILDYELYWGFYLACVGTLMYFLVVAVGTFEAVDIVRQRKMEWDMAYMEQNGGTMEGQDHTYAGVPQRSYNMYNR